MRADQRRTERPGPGALEAERLVLTTPEGLALLHEVAQAPRVGPAELTRWRRSSPAEMVAAAVRLAECRRRAAGKFARAADLWLEPVGLEQATAEPVARHKARRFGPAPLVVDCCSGLGGDAMALAAVVPTIAVDLDPGMGPRLRWNAEVHGVGPRLLAVRARAEAFPIPTGAWVHVDPDRRAGGGGRTRSVAGYAPGIEWLRRLAATSPGGAIKLGPASDFADHFGDEAFEVEVVSLDGECKEATAWFGAARTCRRRATTLPSGATWTDRDAPPPARAPTGDLGSIVFEPDPALGRAGLLDGFAAAHGLRRFAPGIDVLTGDGPIESPWLRAFAVEESLPADLKRVKRRAAERGLGTLEVKIRGMPIRPEEVARRLRSDGQDRATLWLIGGSGQSRALFTRRITPGRASSTC